MYLQCGHGPLPELSLPIISFKLKSLILVVHKLRYLKKWNPPKMGEQLEDLHKLAQMGNRKYPFDEAMREAYQEVFREYLMQAVKPRAVPSSVPPSERSEDHATEEEPK